MTIKALTATERHQMKFQEYLEAVRTDALDAWHRKWDHIRN